MNEVTCIDLSTGREFTKSFSDVYEQRKFIIKCRYSSKVKVIGYRCQCYEEMEYLESIR